MSYAILELDLAAPAASIERVSTPAGDMWTIRCERCHLSPKPRALLSRLLDLHRYHCAEHAAEDAAALTTLLDTAVRPIVPTRIHVASRHRCAAPLDAVHLTEDLIRKVS